MQVTRISDDDLMSGDAQALSFLDKYASPLVGRNHLISLEMHCKSLDILRS